MNNLEYLVIGGTGSLGKTITKLLLSKYNPHGIRIYSRDEFKQWKMKQEVDSLFPDAPIDFLIGDVRDYRRLERACNRVDLIFNCAAMKQVPACESNPIEAVATNITGAHNIIDCAIDNKVTTVMHVSTDKSCYPVNLYGKTKAVAESLFIQANVYSGNKGTKFSCCRYGNVLGSRGSIIPLFREQSKQGEITITDKRMTRFWITLNQVAEFIIKNSLITTGAEIFIPKMPSMKIMDLVDIIAPDCKIKDIGIRKGEKIHECLITVEESRQLIETPDMYIIKDDGEDTQKQWGYYSDTNERWLSKDELKQLIEDNGL